ncbi:MAG: PLP-dependent aminotransferase family protein [Planctomycetaceae bacterium]
MNPVTANFSQRRRWAADQAISFLMQQGVEHPHVVSLAAGLVDAASLPVTEALEVARQVLADNGRAQSALQYGTTQGELRLRQQLADYHNRLEQTATPAANRAASADTIVCTTGSQQLLALLADALLDPGDICLVAAPTYFVFLGVLEGVGARAIALPMDEYGLRMETLQAELQRLESVGELSRVKLIYVVSEFENPTGISLALDRRAELVEIAKTWSKRRGERIYVLEDAAYRELHYDAPPPPSVWSFDTAGDTVIHAATFSKSFSPGLRVGFGLMPGELRDAVNDLKGNQDFGSANFNQHLLAELLASGRFAIHAEQVRAAYRIKRDAMLAAADEFFADRPGVSWVHPHGGLYVWMTLPPHIVTGFDSPLFRRAVDFEQVMYVPGELCFGGPRELRQRNHMRLSFGAQSPAGVREGMRRLSQAVRQVD